MKNSRGFTLLEIAIVVVILGILGAFATIRLQKYIASDQLRSEAWNLYMELRGARTLALKNDCNILVKFITSPSSQCSIYVDINGNGREAGELFKVYKISSPVCIGISTTDSKRPTTAPNTNIVFNASGIVGNWNTTVMTIDNSLGTITSGAIYLRSTRIPNITYCIGIWDAQRSLKIYKWGGAKWHTL
jgi:prepilin-type N-terminal cleavage/methylation domain-containing protein